MEQVRANLKTNNFCFDGFQIGKWKLFQISNMEKLK